MDACENYELDSSDVDGTSAAPELWQIGATRNMLNLSSSSVVSSERDGARLPTFPKVVRPVAETESCRNLPKMPQDKLKSGAHFAPAENCDTNDEQGHVQTDGIAYRPLPKPVPDAPFHGEKKLDSDRKDWLSDVEVLMEPQSIVAAHTDECADSTVHKHVVLLCHCSS